MNEHDNSAFNAQCCYFVSTSMILQCKKEVHAPTPPPLLALRTCSTFDWFDRRELILLQTALNICLRVEYMYHSNQITADGNFFRSSVKLFNEMGSFNFNFTSQLKHSPWGRTETMPFCTFLLNLRLLFSTYLITDTILAPHNNNYLRDDFGGKIQCGRPTRGLPNTHGRSV